MAKKTVYTLDINTAPLVNGYKNAIKQMEQAGVSSKITEKLSTSLAKLESQYKSLSIEAQAGFKTPREILLFEQKVNKLFSAFRGLEVEFDNVGAKLKSVGNLAQQAQQKLQTTFTNLGIKDAANWAEKVAQSENKVVTAEKLIKNELKERLAIVEELKNKQDSIVTSGATVAANIITGDTPGRKPGSNVTRGSFKADVRESNQVNDLLNYAQGAVIMENNFKAAWDNIERYIETNNFKNLFSRNNKGYSTFEEQVKKAFDATRDSAEEARQATELLAQAEEHVGEIGRKNSEGVYKVRRNIQSQITAGAKEVGTAQREESETYKSAKMSIEEKTAAEKTAINISSQLNGVADDTENALLKDSGAMRETAQNALNTSEAFEHLKNNVLSFFTVGSLFNTIRTQIRKTYEDVQQLDKSFASIAMVTDKSLKDLWGSYDQYADMAANLGQQTNDVVKASALYYQQGGNSAVFKS